MKRPVEELVRFRELPPESDDPRVAALFRSVLDPEPSRAEELDAVRRRLARARRSPGTRRARELVIVLAALVSGASVAFAGWGLVDWVRAPTEKTLPDASGPAPARTAAKPSARPRAPMPDHVARPAATAEESASAKPFRSQPPAAAGPSASNGSLEESALSRESRALTGALVALRRQRDANAALTALDAYEAEFPNGALRLEARVARVDALIALGRKSDARAVLVALPLERVGRGPELRLLRAELTAERDCAQALEDLDVLVGAAPPAVHERALYARAGCRFRTGDSAGAESDLRQYLTSHPSGRHASEIRERLGVETP